MAQRDEQGLSGNATLVIGLVACAGLVVVALAGSRFWKTPPPPPAPIPVPSAEHSVNTSLKFTEGYYKALIDQDAKQFHISAPSLESIAAPMPYAKELGSPKTMKADKDQLDTPHLHISTQVSKEWSVTGAAQRMRVEHMMLTITNKSDRAIAYRVDTHPSNAEICKSKGAIAQNALALKPGETIQRTECIWGKGATLEVRSIEVMELPDLGYFYVSRLTPMHVLVDDRAAAGHEPPLKLKVCSFVPWREIRTASEGKGGIGWGDVIDFYARHNCDEYSYFSSYRRWDHAGQLPAQPTAAPAPTGGAP